MQKPNGDLVRVLLSFLGTYIQQRQGLAVPTYG